MFVMVTALLAFIRSAIDGFSDLIRLGLKQIDRLLADILLFFSCGRTSFLRNSIRKARVMKFSSGRVFSSFLRCYFLSLTPWSWIKAS